MRCKLLHFASSTSNPGQGRRPYRGSQANWTLAILLGLALFASAVPVRAQEAASPEAGSPKAASQDARGTISGIVYLPGSNEPASQVAVTLKSHEAGVFRSILTDYDGHFEVSGLPAGTYEVTVEEQEYRPYRSTAEFDGSSLKLELHLTSLAPQPVQSANTVSARELAIPGKAQEEYRKGLVSLAKKELANSLKHFASAVRAFPGYFEAFYHQGIVETDLGHQEAAMQDFQMAVNLSGGRYAQAQFGIGYLYYLQGNAAQAESVTRRGLELDPNSPDGYVILGMTLLRLNRINEAEKSAREALLRDPNHADAYLILADACARRQNYQEQIQHLDTYLKLDPTGSASKRAHEVREVALKILNQTQSQNPVQ
ncbi:MAG TPA: tetratricopeptide repeat protein [Candidatus Acidoferrum sp.]|nr:tetratricopeptide repeat protein [Candidatus Acidoferrum sp.]